MFISNVIEFKIRTKDQIETGDLMNYGSSGRYSYMISGEICKSNHSTKSVLHGSIDECINLDYYASITSRIFV